MKEFWCPLCSTLNRPRLGPRDYIVACCGRDCRVRWVVGDFLWRAPRGKHTPPPDRVQPLFGELNPSVWRSGQPANRLYLDPDEPPVLVPSHDIITPPTDDIITP